jgi:hypothetical protein
MGRVLKLVFTIGIVALLWWMAASEPSVDVEYAE